MVQELSYICCGDYYIPDIRLLEEIRSIGRWGRMHRDYIKEHRPILLMICALAETYGLIWLILTNRRRTVLNLSSSK